MKKKTIALLLVLMMIFGVTCGGTIAYLTSKTDTVVNTFTVGNVQIKLDEAKVDEYGVPQQNVGTAEEPEYEATEKVENAERVIANTYKLIPGHSYTKDPTVTVTKGSEQAYVRTLVTVTFEKTLTDAQIATQLDEIFTGESAKWVRYDKKIEVENEKTVISYEYRYNEIVDARNADEDIALDALFTGFTIPEDMNVGDLGGFKMDVIAHAIQADGFVDTEDMSAEEIAWENF